MTLIEIEERIIQVLENEIRPNLALDGGDAKYCGFSDGVVKLEFCGACLGCPHAFSTLKNYIEKSLKNNIPEVVAVELINSSNE